MNKEKILNKIGALIDKADLTEEDLAKFFANDETTETTEAKVEQPEAEAVETDKAEDKESDKAEVETAPEDEKPEAEAKEEPKSSSEAVPEVKAEEPTNYVTRDEMTKLIEGYKAEVDSLRDTLKKAKVLEQVSIKDEKQVGYGTTSTPNLQHGESGLEATLAKLNRGRH